MTCNQLAGACDKAFHADTFNEIAEMSKKHAIEMVEKGDKTHIKKMEEMMHLMKNPEAVNEWFEKTQKKFDSLPVDN